MSQGKQNFTYLLTNFNSSYFHTTSYVCRYNFGRKKRSLKNHTKPFVRRFASNPCESPTASHNVTKKQWLRKYRCDCDRTMRSHPCDFNRTTFFYMNKKDASYCYTTSYVCRDFRKKKKGVSPTANHNVTTNQRQLSPSTIKDNKPHNTQPTTSKNYSTMTPPARRHPAAPFF